MLLMAVVVTNRRNRRNAVSTVVVPVPTHRPLTLAVADVAAATRPRWAQLVQLLRQLGRA